MKIVSVVLKILSLQWHYLIYEILYSYFISNIIFHFLQWNLTLIGHRANHKSTDDEIPEKTLPPAN